MKNLNFSFLSLFLVFAFSFTIGTVNAQDKPASSADELAKQMQNPIASLISLPFQNNFDFGAGAADGSRWTMNIQPVIPISISTDWNLISRTILPVVSQNDIFYSFIQKYLRQETISLRQFFSQSILKLIFGYGAKF